VEASTEAVPIRAKLVAPPLYVLGTNATDKVRRAFPLRIGVFFSLTLRPGAAQYAAVERLERAIEVIQGAIEEEGGDLTVKMKVCVCFFPRGVGFYADASFARVSPRLCRRRRSRIWRSSWQRLGRRMLRCRVTRMRSRSCSKSPWMY